jgi:hypothetical protein
VISQPLTVSAAQRRGPRHVLFASREAGICKAVIGCRCAAAATVELALLSHEEYDASHARSSRRKAAFRDRGRWTVTL